MSRDIEEVWGRTVPAALGPGAVHLWYGSVRLLAPYEPRFREALSSDEQGRAERFHFACDRTRFVLRRGALRFVLAGYVAADPADIRFETGPWGRPELTLPGPRFSQSASDGLTVIAVAGRQQVGVDVERIRPSPDLDRVAVRMFTRRELSDARALSESSRIERFFDVWTRKEAFAKALGLGLRMPFDAFEVSEKPAAGWSLEGLAAPSGYRAALCLGPTTGSEPPRWRSAPGSPAP
jgi:4'-phosphopantetheinyl transferase